jgi:hypothetical protein
LNRADTERDASWVHELTLAEVEDLRRARAVLSGGPLTDIQRGTAALPELGVALGRWREELRSGRGFVLVRGLPVQEGSTADAARLYWLLGRRLGDAVLQNGAGGMDANAVAE